MLVAALIPTGGCGSERRGCQQEAPLVVNCGCHGFRWVGWLKLIQLVNICHLASTVAFLYQIKWWLSKLIMKNMKTQVAKKNNPCSPGIQNSQVSMVTLPCLFWQHSQTGIDRRPPWHSEAFWGLLGSQLQYGISKGRRIPELGAGGFSSLQVWQVSRRYKYIKSLYI